jgi:hypothetical protein
MNEVQAEYITDDELKELMQDGILNSILQDKRAVKKIEVLAKEMIEYASIIWGWGDGYGGVVYEMIFAEFEKAGLLTFHNIYELNNKSRHTRIEIFERDKYRCKKCGDWHGLTIDHIVPRSKGGTDELGNLQTLCHSCNSKKGAKIETV